MRFSVLFSFSLLSLSLLSYLFQFTWFDFLPASELIGNTLISISFMGSTQGILIPLIFLSIHYATTAKECWRVFYCAFPLLTIALLLGWGTQFITEQPRPNVTNLVGAGVLSADYYQQPMAEKHTLMENALAQANDIPDYLKSEWIMETSYAMPSAHAIASWMVALYFATLFFARQQTITGFIILAWAFVAVFSRLLMGLQRPEDILVGAVIGALAAQLALLNRRRKLNEDQAIAELKGKKMAEQQSEPSTLSAKP